MKHRGMTPLWTMHILLAILFCSGMIRAEKARTQAPISRQDIWQIEQESVIDTISADTESNTRRVLIDRYEYSPIRIAIETRFLDRIKDENEDNADKIAWLQTQVFPLAVDFWQNALSVVPLRENLVIRPSQLVNGELCGFPGDVDPVPQEHFSDGLNDTDLVVYVSASSAYCQYNELAVSALCNTNAITDRPTATGLNLCFDRIQLPLNKERTDKYVRIAIHELAHNLGFSSNAFILYRDSETGLPRTPRPFIKKWTTCTDVSRQQISRPAENTLQIVSSFSVFGQSYMAQIVTPRVVQVVRNQFNCQRLEGAPLHEPLYDKQCWGDHWNERIFHTELMSPVQDHSVDVVSPLTLALLEDSGWYVANYTMSQISLWGYQAGCDFVEKPCLIKKENDQPEVPISSRGFFCNDPKQFDCSVDLMRKQRCSVLQYPGRGNSYFSLDESLGGLAELDFCPVIQSDYTSDEGGQELQLDCRGEEPIFNLYKVAKTFSDESETFGPASRCISSDAGQGLCLHTECSKDELSLRLYIGGREEPVVCSEDFQTHNVVMNTAEIPVQIVCPRLSQACPELFCPYNCAGAGACEYPDPSSAAARPVCRCFDPDDYSQGCTGVWKSMAPSSSPTSTPQPTVSRQPSTTPSSSSPPSISPAPSMQPSINPTEIPSSMPSGAPQENPTATPSLSPSISPSSTKLQKPCVLCCLSLSFVFSMLI